MSDTTDPQTLYTVNDVAYVLSEDPDTVARQATTGRIPSRKVGRTRLFTAQDIADHLDTLRPGGAA